LRVPFKCSLHILTDGRDVADGSSLKFVEELEGVLKGLEVGAAA
jgi:bisphosphoglycerate-independent phosphoglycerate mutase (AlkP superfamily)